MRAGQSTVRCFIWYANVLKPLKKSTVILRMKNKSVSGHQTAWDYFFWKILCFRSFIFPTSRGLILCVGNDTHGVTWWKFRIRTEFAERHKNENLYRRGGVSPPVVKGLYFFTNESYRSYATGGVTPPLRHNPNGTASEEDFIWIFITWNTGTPTPTNNRWILRCWYTINLFFAKFPDFMSFLFYFYMLLYVRYQ